VAKRSPILGYNHNVRYRGLIFHVQTEDSGVMSPHLFTHLFYEGVIVSTRKLVYDASASEEAIKALMQAQHKAVLKDLKIHTFDDKIDAYLSNAPGLEPRGGLAAPAVPRMSDPEITIEAGSETTGERAGTDPDATEQIEKMDPVIAAAVAPPEPAKPARAKRKSTVPPPKKPAVPAVIADELSKPRTQTAERTSRGSFRSMTPPQPVAAAPELIEILDELGGNTVPTTTLQGGMAAPFPPPTPRANQPRAATPPPIPQRAAASKTAITVDSSPEIEIIEGPDSGRTRTVRDTAVDDTFGSASPSQARLADDAIPMPMNPDATIPSDGIPPRPAPSASRPPSAGAAQGAALLPAMRQPSRPAITPPSVVSRPLPPDPNRNRGDSEAIEIYAPAPPSVEPPPGERTERPGQYSMNRRIPSQENVPLRDHTGRVAVPAGLARPRPPNQSQSSPIVRPASNSSPPIPQPPGRTTPPSQSDVIRSHTQSDGIPQLEPEQRRPPSSVPEQRVATPTRTPHITAPIASRTGTGNAPNNNVITTRPAVIVGAPTKPHAGTPTPQRVRKAREDEGRGFGQGLISEKSLDEVILAYLSEDADEK
jgi:hypothetical protein